jgi:hypothetical protein
MKIFTIENETNNISIHTTIQEAEAVTNAEWFRNEGEMAKLAADWPAARLVEIWNGLPDVTPIKKFKDRATAISRIWKAIQSLGGTVGAESTRQTEIAPVIESPEQAELMPATAECQAGGETTPPETEGKPLVTEQAISESREADVVTPVAPQTPNVAPEKAPAKKKTTRAKKTPTPTTEAKGSREGSKTETVLELLKREGGVTAKELMTATGWQPHSIRGFVSGTVGKKMGLTVESTRGTDGERTYSIKG